MTIVIDKSTIDSKVENEFLKAPFLLYKGYQEVMVRFKGNSDLARSDEYPTFFEKYKLILEALEERGKIEGAKKSDYVDDMVNQYVRPVLEGINKIAGISDEDLESLKYKANLDAHIAYSKGVKEHASKTGFWRSPITWFGAITFAALTYVTGFYFYARQDMQDMYDENFAKVQLEIEQGKKYMQEQREAVKKDLQKIVDDGLQQGDKILEHRIQEGVDKIEYATSLNPFKRRKKD